MTVKNKGDRHAGPSGPARDVGWEMLRPGATGISAFSFLLAEQLLDPRIVLLGLGHLGALLP